MKIKSENRQKYKSLKSLLVVDFKDGENMIGITSDMIGITSDDVAVNHGDTVSFDDLGLDTLVDLYSIYFHKRNINKSKKIRKLYSDLKTDVVNELDGICQGFDLKEGQIKMLDGYVEVDDETNIVGFTTGGLWVSNSDEGFLKPIYEECSFSEFDVDVLMEVLDKTKKK